MQNDSLPIIPPSALQMTASRIYEEFQRRNIECHILEARYGTILYRHPTTGKRHVVVSSLSDLTPATAMRIADKKPIATELATRLNIPVPASLDIDATTPAETLTNFLAHYQRIVVKPADSAHGYGVSVGITSEDQLNAAIHNALRHSKKVIIQEEVSGDDVRVIIVGGEYMSAMVRRPANVIGDGVHTVEQLINAENTNNPHRSEDFTTQLSAISLEAAHNYLQDQFYQIPPARQPIRVVGPANMSLGGTIDDFFDQVPPQAIADAKKITEYLGMIVCGVDYIVNPEDGSYKLLEINAMPALYEHDDPEWNMQRGVVKKFVDCITQA